LLNASTALLFKVTLPTAAAELLSVILHYFQLLTRTHQEKITAVGNSGMTAVPNFYIE
jgi:hypothetical protein